MAAVLVRDRQLMMYLDEGAGCESEELPRDLTFSSSFCGLNTPILLYCDV